MGRCGTTGGPGIMTLFRLREGDGQSRAINTLDLEPLDHLDGDRRAAEITADEVRLIAEIEGSGHVRFATGADGRLGPVSRMSMDRFSGFDAALDAFMEGASKPTGRVHQVTIAADDVSEDGAVGRTGWTVPREALKRRFLGAPVRFYSRLEAIALATPHLGAIGTETLRDGEPQDHAPRLVLEIGDRFKGALAVPDGDDWRTVETHPGDMSFAGASAEETRLIGTFRDAGDFLAGDGLARLHRRLGGGSQTAEQVFQVAKHHRAAASAVGIYGRYLGRLAADMALMTGARGGIWLAGLTSAGDDFRRSFLAGLASRDVRGLTELPVRRITLRHPALVGLANVDSL